ncbi:MAG: hypothetical protein IT357_15710 [Gemmatimonadaceae bacterium]|nr:hypothetical protein [Gemmatimonadaceae bacterium]
MADILKLKKKAADFEAKKQMDKALAVYREIIEAYESGDEDPVDIPLYNRVGDLMQKAGNLAEAVSVWERAVDQYTDGGFYNPAIALCNKILRQSPGRAIVYYKLGKISAEKGFKSDARQNFLEYASRMQKAGNLDEAFRALKEFADLVPDQDDVRLMLADQLVKADRKKEAIEQLQIAYAQAARTNRDADMGTIADKIKAIDPSVEPRADDDGGGSKTGGLVFLDLDGGPSKRASAMTPALKTRQRRVTKAVEGLNLLHVEEEPSTGPSAPAPAAPAAPAAAAPAAPARPTPAAPPKVEVKGGLTFIMPDPTPAEPIQAVPAEPEAAAPPDAATLDGLMIEPTAAPAEAAPDANGGMLGLEPTLIEEPSVSPDAIETVETVQRIALTESEQPVDLPIIESPSASVDTTVDIPMLEIEPTVVAPPPEVLRRTMDIPIVESTPVADDLPIIELPSASFTPADLPPTDAPSIESATDVAPDLEIDVPPTPTASMPPVLVDLPVLEVPKPRERTATPLDMPSTAERAIPRRSEGLDGAIIPETTERAIPRELTPSGLTPANTGSVASSDFGAFGAPAGAAEESPTFEPLQVESSEGVHAFPLDENYVARQSGLLEPPPPPPLPPISDEELASAKPPARATSVILATSVDRLRDRAADAPEDWGLRRQLAEAMLDDGQRESGIAELEVALKGYERDGDLDTAASIAEEIVRLAPNVIAYHQKRVEFAFRANDRRRLGEAYVELADALVRDGQGAKARVVYQRVLEIDPEDLRAQAALETIAEAPVPEPAPAPRRSTKAMNKSSASAPSGSVKKPAPEEDYISLGDWFKDDDLPKSTRMVVEEKEPTGDEQADFADMLRKFKQGVADNVDDEDHEAHYDLGVAYKEMGLLDEAISEFQKALRGSNNRVRAIESLGLCFVEKQQLPVAATILQRALAEPGVADEQLIGVLYLLGTIAEELHLFPDAKKHYQRVFAVDINFRDIGDRLNAVEKQLS